MDSSNILTFFSSKSALIAIIILLLISHSSTSATTKTPTHKSRLFKKIYAFGDSYTDTGNTDSSTGPTGYTHVSSLPYGRTFFHHPTNRYSDGRLVIDFLAESLSLPYLPPYRNRKADTTRGVNFAVAGCTAIPYSYFVKNKLFLDNMPESLETQLKWFDEHLHSRVCAGATTSSMIRECEKEELKDALVWIGSIGSNDYSYALGTSVPIETIQRLAIKSLTNFLQGLLSKGAKYVVVQGLTARGCLTLSLALSQENDRDNLGCVASTNNQSYIHNTVLQSKLKQLRKQFPHAVIVYADYMNSLTSVVKNAKSYGFEELHKACCGSPDGPFNFDIFNTCGSPESISCQDPFKYVNWDGGHLTEAMYKVLAHLFINGSFSQPPFEHLLSKKRSSLMN